MACDTLSLQVSLGERVNGKTVGELRRRGVIGMVPAPPYSTMGNKRVFLRMALPLLSLLNDMRAVGCEAMVPTEFLDWIRPYSHKSHERVQLFSLRVSLEALCVMEVDPPRLTLGNLRPGAVFSTEALRDTAVLVDKEAIKRAVLKGTTSHIPIFPSEDELKIHASNTSAVAMVHYSNSKEAGVDALIHFGNNQGGYYMQSKGLEDILKSTSAGPGLVGQHARKMRARTAKAQVLALELCYVPRVASLEGTASLGALQGKAASSVRVASKQGDRKKLKKAKLAVAELKNDRLVIIHKGIATATLGWVFAGALEAADAETL
jgi:hypothetical protein